MFGIGIPEILTLAGVIFSIYFFIICLMVPFYIRNIKQETYEANWRLGQILKIMKEEKKLKEEAPQDEAPAV